MASRPDYAKLQATMQSALLDMCSVYEMEPIKLTLGTGVVINGVFSTKMLGLASYRSREIYIDRRLLLEHLMDTLKHEFAHFMAHDFDRANGHGWIWRMHAKRLGCEPRATCHSWVFRPEETW